MAKVTGFVSGHLTAPAAGWRAGDPLDVKVTIPVPCYLIESAGERILLDTGLHPQGGPARYGPAAEALGWDPPSAPPDADPTLILLTHLHFDHAGGLAAYPEVPVVVQRTEWDAAHDPVLIESVIYAPVDYHGIEPTLIDGEQDLLGDGSVVTHPTPGHTLFPRLDVNALPIRQRVFVENDSALVDCQSV